MNMEVKQKCPFNKSVLQLVLRFVLMVLGTVGLIFLNIWVAVAYLIYYVVFFFLAMPLKHCQINRKTEKRDCILIVSFIFENGLIYFCKSLI